MQTKVKIKNIGKLEDAEVGINKFTVIAGPNNSGKSFVSKTVYSIIEALNGDHVERYFQRLLEPSLNRFSFIAEHLETPQEKQIKAIVEKLEQRVIGTRYKSLEDIRETATNLVGDIDNLLNRGEQDLSNDVNDYVRATCTAALESLREIRGDLATKEADRIIEISRSEELQRTFIRNFQVAGVPQIKNEQENPISVEIDSIGKFEYSQETFKSQLHVPWPSSSIDFSTIIYLESPVYVKLMRILDRRELLWSSYRRRMQLSGVPGYIHNLADLLKNEYVGEIAFPKVYEKLTSTEIMGGQLTVSDTGEIQFQENGKHFPLSITATGVANIGMLSLLIQRKALDKDSLLFVDEPEAHLHPAWQVFLAESLFELAREGVHVVIATHSLEILKWLEVHIKHNPQDKNFVALNQISMQNQPLLENIAPSDFESKLTAIKSELASPFVNLYLDGL